MNKEKSLEKIARAVLLSFGEKKSKADIYLVSDRFIHQLNLKYRKKDKPTTVLSFVDPKIPHPETKLKVLGEIYLAPSYIKKTEGNIEELLIHGLLHLLGYEHEKKDDKIKMEEKEKELFQKILS